MASDVELDDTLMAVMAHGLLTSMSVVAGSIGLLRDAWEEIDADEREALLAKAEEQALHVGAVLTDLVRGLPAEVLEHLDRLRPRAS
jgi:K+-sensing histidine kinase KdpD